MENKIRSLLEQSVTHRVFPGCVVGVIDELEQKHIVPVGKQTYDKDALQIAPESVFDVASVTKAIPVSSLALHLIDTNTLSLHRPVRELLPELETTYRDQITVWHLLTQTLSFTTSLASLKSEKPEAILHAILTTRFTTPPGEKVTYTNATSILLGMVIERATGKSIDELAREVFFEPMGMNHTTFHPELLEQQSIVPTENDPWRKRILRGEIHDESAFILKERMIPGSAGIFSTAPDLLIFLQMLVQRGILNGKRYFSEEMISRMGDNQLDTVGEVCGLGWELNQTRYMGNYSSSHTIGKTGFTGCMVIADLIKNRALVMLSNYHFPRRKDRDATELNQVRRAIADIVFSENS